jgi:hypothetical protein
MHCPNILSPQWKNLVEKIGETNAWREFFKYGTIPNVENYDVNKTVSLEDQTQILKPGVAELFESNPELANAVYESLGFDKNNKTVNFSDTDVKEEVYHSSTNEFNEFKQGKDGAIHFGDKKAATERTNKSSKKYLKKVKLKVNNLVETVDSVDFEGTLKDKKSKIYIVEKLGLAKTETQEHLIALFANEKITKEQLEQYWDSSLETIYKEIFNADGYSYINLAENKGSKSYVVFNPNQIEVIEDGEIKYNENTKEYEYVNITNQITPQQKQQAQQIYSQYLDTIFPDSQVKNVLLHGTGNDFNTFDKALRGTTTDKSVEGNIFDSEMAFFFTDSEYTADNYSLIKRQKDIIDITNNLYKVILSNSDSQKAYNYLKSTYPLFAKYVDELKADNYSQSKIKEELVSLYKKFNSLTDLTKGGSISNSKDYYRSLNKKLNEAIANKTVLNLNFQNNKNFFNHSNDGIISTSLKELNGLNIKDLSTAQKEIIYNSFKEAIKEGNANIDSDIKKGGFTPKIIRAVINIKNPVTKDYKGMPFVDQIDSEGARPDLTKTIKNALNSGKDSVIAKNIKDPGLGNNYAVFEPEQIHILGNEQDIEGFKKFTFDNINKDILYKSIRTKSVEEIAEGLDSKLVKTANDVKYISFIKSLFLNKINNSKESGDVITPTQAFNNTKNDFTVALNKINTTLEILNAEKFNIIKTGDSEKIEKLKTQINVNLDINKNTTYEEFVDALSKYKNNYTNIINNFTRYEDYVVLELAHLGLKIKRKENTIEAVSNEEVSNNEQDLTEDNSGISVEELNTERFDKSINETNLKNTARVRVKTLLLTLKTGESEFGIPLYANPDDVFDDLLEAGAAMELSGYTKYDTKYLAFTTAIKNKAAVRPYLNDLINKLAKYEVNNEWEKINEILTVATVAYVNEKLFLYNTVKVGNEIIRVNNIKIIDSNVEAIEDQVAKDWLIQHKTSDFFIKDVSGDLKPDPVKVKQLEEELTKGKNGSDQDKHNAFLNFFNILGIKLVDKDVDYIFENAASALGKGSNFNILFLKNNLLENIYNSFLKNIDVPFDSQYGQYGFQDEKTDMLKIAKLYYDVNPGLYNVVSSKSADGKTKYLYIQPNYVENKKREWKNKKYSILKNSALSIPNLDFWKKITDNIYKFSLNYFSGGREQESNKRGKVRKQLTPKEQYAANFMMHQANIKTGTYLAFTLSDKTSTISTEITKEFFVDSKATPVGKTEDYNINENGDVVFTSKLKNQIYNSFVEPEVSRILAALYNKSTVNLENFNISSKLFYVIPNINANPKLKEFRTDLYSGNFTMKEISDKYSTLVGEEVLNELELSATQQVKQFTDMGFFELNNGVYQFPLFDNSLINTSYVSRFRNANIKNADQPKMMILDLKLNYINAQVKTIQFLRFDPMFAYKHIKGITTEFNNLTEEDKIKLAKSTWDEFSKRAAALVAPGSQGNWQWSGIDGNIYRAGTENKKGQDGIITYNSITVNDYERIINGIGNNVTDAQEFVTVQEYIDTLMSDGKISHKVWLSITKKIKAAGPGGYYELTKKELGYLFSPSKPVHVNDVNVGDENSGLNRIDYIKSSRYPLIPDEEAGSERNKMRIWMEKNDIRSLNFKSAKKLGRPTSSVTIFDKDGNFVEPSETDTKNAIQVLSRDGLRTQQEIPNQKKEIKTVSQMNRTLFDKMLESTFSIGGMQNIKGDVAKKLKEKVRSKLFDINADKLKEKIGADLTESHRGLHDLFKDVILNDTTGTYTSNDLESIKLNSEGFFEVPLEFQSKKIQSLINSLIDKNIMLKVDGSSFVQVSGVGAKYELSDINSTVRSSIVWLDSHVNKFKKDEKVGLDYISLENNKVKSAQIIVSQYMTDGDGKLINLKDYISIVNGLSILDTSKFSPELFQLVATRIPNQSLVSTLPVEVVGFLPDYMENTIIVPDGITGQMGSDFDVDKLYTYMSKAYKNENDEYKIQQYVLNDLNDVDNFTEEQLKQLYVDIHWMVLTHPDAYAQITKSVDMNEPKKKVEDRNDLLKKYNITQKDTVNLPLDFSTSVERFIDNRSGKTGVAVFANLQSAQADFQDKIFRLGTDGKENPIKVRFDVNGESEIVDLLYIGQTGSYTSKKDEKEVTRSISDNINIMFSESVDNAKNLFLREFNWDEKAMSAIGLFAMLSDKNNNSIPIEFAMDLTSQSVIKTLFNKVDIKQDAFGEYDLDAMVNATKELREELVKEIDNENYLPAGKQAIDYLTDQNRDAVLDPKMLADSWLIGQAVINNNEEALKQIAKDLNYSSVNDMLLNYYTVQYDSLNLFERLNNAGRELMTILGVAYVYTKGIGPNVFSTNQKINHLSIFLNSKEFIDLENITGSINIADDDLSIDSDISANDDISITPNGEIGESIKQSLLYAKDTYKQIFPISSGLTIKKIVNNLLNGLGKKYQDLNKNDFEFYFNEVFDSIISVLNTHPDLELFDNVSELRNRIINGKTSIGYRITELKKNPVYANNRFLKNIEVDNPKRTDVHLIRFKDPFGSSMDETSIMSGFYELALSEEAEVKQLAKDLALYPYVTGNAGYLRRYIPNGYYNSDEDFVKAMNNMLKVYEKLSTNDNFISLIVDQIVQNNPNEYSTKFRYQTTIDEKGARNNVFKKIFSSLIKTTNGETNNLTGLNEFTIKVGNFTKTNDAASNKIAESLKVKFTDNDTEALKSILNKPEGIDFKYPSYILINDSEINDLGDYTKKTDLTYLYKKVSAIVTPDGDATYKRINILEYKGIKQFDITNPDLKSSIKNNNISEEAGNVETKELMVSEETTNVPKGEKIKPGIYVNQEALTKEEQLELFDYLKPFLESQGKKTNMGANAPIMIGLGLRWDYKRNNPDKTPINIGKNLAGGNTSYAYYDLSIDGKPLGQITPRFVELMNKTTGIDITNYDGAIINLYSNGSFIGNHSDLEESATAEKYPVIVANIGGTGNIVIGNNKDKVSVDLKAGSGYLFGFNGENRKIQHSTYASEVKGFLPSINISQENKTFNTGSYRISITMRRVMPLIENMSETPLLISEEVVTEQLASDVDVSTDITTEEETSEVVTVNYGGNQFIYDDGKYYYTKEGGKGAEVKDKNLEIKIRLTKAVLDNPQNVVNLKIGNSEQSYYSIDNRVFSLQPTSFGKEIVSNNIKNRVLKEIDNNNITNINEPNPVITNVSKITSNNIILPTIEINGKKLETFRWDNSKKLPITLTNDQLNAVRKIINYIETNPKVPFILKGKAGTGKTTVIRIINEYFKNKSSVIITPTHKAGKNASIVTYGTTQNKYRTFASAFYSKLNTPKEDILLFDEVSMLNDKDLVILNNKLKNFNRTVIFMGDIRQLPPVKSSKVSPFFNSKNDNNVYELTEVMRFDKQGSIFKIADRFAENLSQYSVIKQYPNYLKSEKDEFYAVDSSKRLIDSYIYFYRQENNNPSNVRLITYGNKTAEKYNNEIRNIIFKGNLEYNIVQNNDLLNGNAGWSTKSVLSNPILNSSEYFVKDEPQTVSKKYKEYSYEGQSLKLSEIVNGNFDSETYITIVNPTDSKNLKLFKHIASTIINFKNTGKEYESSFNDELDKIEKSGIYSLTTMYAKPISTFNNKVNDVELYTLDQMLKIIKSEKPSLSENEIMNLIDNEQYNEYYKIEQNISFGYAITTHKSQGSTYKHTMVDEVNISFKDENRKINDQNNNFYAYEANQMRYVSFSRPTTTLVVYTNKPIGDDLIYNNEYTKNIPSIPNVTTFDPMAMLLAEQAEEAVNDTVNEIFGNGMDSKTILNNFYKVASPFYKSLLKLVSDSGGVNNLRFNIDYNLMDPGQYDSFNKVITINPNLLKDSGDVVQIKNAIHDVIMHELLHYLTVDTINADKSKLSAEQRKWVMSLENLFKATQAKLLNDPIHSAKLKEAIEQVNKEGGFLSASDKSMYYGLTNIYDFISMLMSDNEFQNFMNTIEHSADKSIIERFIELVTKLIESLGIKVKDQSVLNEGIKNIVYLINERNNVSLSSVENQRSIITSNRNELIKNNISNIIDNLNLKTNCK